MLQLGYVLNSKTPVVGGMAWAASSTTHAGHLYLTRVDRKRCEARA